MIQRLNTQDLNVCAEILLIQFKAYQREAALINFEVPPLLETTSDIHEASETYFGVVKNQRILGAVALEEDGDALDICKLFVDPAHFRQGVARRLLTHCEEWGRGLGKRRLIVSTGSSNSPAIRLYLGFGFEKKQLRQIPEGPEIVEFEKILGLEEDS